MPTLSKLFISFAWTTEAFLNGTKTATRRYWKESHVAKFRADMVVRALDKNYRAGGKQVGWARITKDPYLQPLSEMTQEDFIAEGGTQYWDTLADYQWMMKKEGQDPYVVECERCDEQGEPIMSSDEQREDGLKGLTLAKAIECARKTLEACWDEAWADKDTAARVYEEDGKKEHEFRYKIGLPLVIRPKGSGNIDVSIKARWGVVKTCELEAMTVSDHPELDLDGPGGDGEAEGEE